MSVQDLRAPQGHQLDSLDKLWEGTILDTATAAGEGVRVAIKDIDGGVHSYGPCSWMPRGTAMPQVGARCLVAVDEKDDAWIVVWEGSVDPALPALASGQGLLWDGAAWVATDLATQAELDQQGVLTGMMFTYIVGVAPAGYLICQGQGVTAVHAALRALLVDGGSPHGTDGSGDPRLPDSQGRALIGTGQGAGLTNRALGASGGAEAHVLTVAQMPAHTHPTNLGIIATVNAGTQVNLAGSQAGGVVTGATGGDVAHNNMQPFVAVPWIVKT